MKESAKIKDLKKTLIEDEKNIATNLIRLKKTIIDESLFYLILGKTYSCYGKERFPITKEQATSYFSDFSDAFAVLIRNGHMVYVPPIEARGKIISGTGMWHIEEFKHCSVEEVSSSRLMSILKTITKIKDSETRKTHCYNLIKKAKMENLISISLGGAISPKRLLVSKEQAIDWLKSYNQVFSIKVREGILTRIPPVLINGEKVEYTDIWDLSCD